MLRMHFFITILLSLILSGCLPTVFTAATTSTIAVAKDDSSLGIVIDDTKISAKIKADLIKNGFRDLYTKINVDVLHGKVLYTGTVATEEDMMKAVKIAWDQSGVKEVANELKVDKNSSKFDLLQYTKDTMITSQIKSKLFIHRDIRFINYTVITINNIVYLFGVARSQEEIEKVADIASKINGVEKVVCHVKEKEARPNSLE